MRFSELILNFPYILGSFSTLRIFQIDIFNLTHKICINFLSFQGFFIFSNLATFTQKNLNGKISWFLSFLIVLNIFLNILLIQIFFIKSQVVNCEFVLDDIHIFFGLWRLQNNINCNTGGRFHDGTDRINDVPVNVGTPYLKTYFLMFVWVNQFERFCLFLSTFHPEFQTSLR